MEVTENNHVVDAWEESFTMETFLFITTVKKLVRGVGLSPVILLATFTNLTSLFVFHTPGV